MLNAFEMVSLCSPLDGYTFDPGTHIRAVNALLAQSHANLIADLRDHVRTARNRAGMGVLLLLRLLFEPIGSQTAFPPLCIGKLTDVDSPPLSEYPLYPLVLAEDVPLLIVTGFFLGGLPSDPWSHIKFCEEHCRMRSKALRPPDNPLGLADDVLASPDWYRAESDHDHGVLRAQVLRLVRSVHRVPGIDEPDFFTKVTSDEVWNKHLESYTAMQAVWDTTNDDYRRC